MVEIVTADLADSNGSLQPLTKMLHVKVKKMFYIFLVFVDRPILLLLCFLFFDVFSTILANKDDQKTVFAARYHGSKNVTFNFTCI